MYNSLEMRVPFLDKSLVEFGLSRKNYEHVDVLTTKKMLRKIAEKKFPRNVSHRKKRGFGIPLAQWMQGPIQKLVTHELNNPQIYEFFDKKSVSTIWENHLNGKQNHTKQIWTLVMLSGWVKHWMK